jgi:hypothetical protein
MPRTSTTTKAVTVGHTAPPPRTEGPVQYWNKRPCARRGRAEDNWLRELFAGIPDLRDAELAGGSRVVRS